MQFFSFFMAINRFLQYLEFEKRYSAHTLTAYKGDLEEFCLFIEHEYAQKDVITANYMQIRSWLVTLIENKLSPRTVTRKISTLKSFYHYLLCHQEISINPMTKILSPKTGKKLPVFVEKEKMETLLNGKEFDNDFEGIRDRLIIELLYCTGMRLSELINIKIKDVDVYNSTVKVLGKRNKERIIPVLNHLNNLIKTYLESTHPTPEENASNLITTVKGKKVYPKLIYRTVNTYLSKITTADKKSPHVLRHTFATHMLNNGSELNAIKELLGHANLSATQVYTHNTIEKLKSIYKQAHPKA